MPTQQSDDTLPLSPALHYLLMTGAWSSSRIHGWVALAQVPLSEMDRHVRTVWAEWAEELTAEARACGFTPAGLGSKRSCGPTVDRWRAAFLAAHTY